MMRQRTPGLQASLLGAALLLASLGNLPYTYAPSLFGPDDPFYGYEPPLLTYPPWWRAVNARAFGGVPYAPANPQALPNAGTIPPNPGVPAAAATSAPVTVPVGP